MLDFCHTYFHFKDIIRTDFCEIYMYFMGFFRRQITKFFKSLNSWTGLLPVDRNGQPLQKSVDRSGRRTCTNVHASLGWWAGRPGGRPSRELCSLEMAPIARPVDRQRAAALCIQSRSTGGSTVIKMTVGRSTGRSMEGQFCPLSDCQQADFKRV